MPVNAARSGTGLRPGLRNQRGFGGGNDDFNRNGLGTAQCFFGRFEYRVLDGLFRFVIRMVEGDVDFVTFVTLAY